MRNSSGGYFHAVRQKIAVRVPAAFPGQRRRGCSDQIMIFKRFQSERVGIRVRIRVTVQREAGISAGRVREYPQGIGAESVHNPNANGLNRNVSFSVSYNGIV